MGCFVALVLGVPFPWGSEDRLALVAASRLTHHAGLPSHLAVEWIRGGPTPALRDQIQVVYSMGFHGSEREWVWVLGARGKLGNLAVIVQWAETPMPLQGRLHLGVDGRIHRVGDVPLQPSWLYETFTPRRRAPGE